MKARCESSPTGRLNPNPLTLRASANNTLQQLRAEDIRIKDSYNRNDQDLIQERIKKDCDILRNTALGLRDNSSRLTGNERVFNDRRLSAQERVKEVGQILGKLGIAPQALREIRLRPFTTYRDRILNCLKKFESRLAPGQYHNAKEALAEIFLVCKVFGSQRILEELKVSLVRSDANLSTELDTAIKRLALLVAHKTLFTEPVGIEETRTPDSLNTLADTIRTRVEGLQAKYLVILQREIKQKHDVALETDREEFRQKALETLKDFDPEKLLKSLANL
jgi:hypothetical protein